MTLAFAMTIGPGEADMAIDNLEAISSLYPGAVTWVRDDVTKDGTWEKVKSWSAGKKVHLSRNPESYGYYGILKTWGQLLLEVEPSQPDILIKIDPDTVLIRRGLDDLFHKRFAQYGKGICGSYLISATGGKRNFRHHGTMIVLDMLPIGPKKKQKGLRRLRPGPVGYFPFILRALLHGYRPGEHVQGGLYAIEGSILTKLKSSGFLKAIAFGRSGMVWTEDVLLSLGVKAIGGRISSLNEGLIAAPTHIQAIRPLQISQDRLYGPDLLAIHPVKAVDSELRNVLRDIRVNAIRSA
jgi:hypothetical protein